MASHVVKSEMTVAIEQPDGAEHAVLQTWLRDLPEGCQLPGH